LRTCIAEAKDEIGNSIPNPTNLKLSTRGWVVELGELGQEEHDDRPEKAADPTSTMMSDEIPVAFEVFVDPIGDADLIESNIDSARTIAKC
jgi:hypothetical protein